MHTILCKTDSQARLQNLFKVWTVLVRDLHGKTSAKVLE